jgi:hypothetical protein
MRDAINSNPLVQLAVVGVLLLATGFFFLSSTGGGGEEEAAPESPEATLSIAGDSLPSAIAPVTPSATVTPPLPRPVLEAWRANRPLVLLFVRGGGIDDRLVAIATAGVAGFRDAAVFVVPAAKISRYAAITEGVGVERVPALVVVTPRDVNQTVPTASVSYGFQSPQSVAQAVIDAGYEGPTVDYHP